VCIEYVDIWWRVELKSLDHANAMHGLVSNWVTSSIRVWPIMMNSPHRHWYTLQKWWEWTPEDVGLHVATENRQRWCGHDSLFKSYVHLPLWLCIERPVIWQSCWSWYELYMMRWYCCSTSLCVVIMSLCGPMWALEHYRPPRLLS